MKILIPTFLREQNQVAYNLLPPKIKRRTILITHSNRADILRQHNPTAAVVDLGKTDGIADVRQKIMDWAYGSETKILMMDDACKFFTSQVVGSKRVIHPTPMKTYEEWKGLLDLIEAKLDTYPQVGISHRPGNNRNLNTHITPGRCYSCYGLNVKYLNDVGVRFDGMYRKDINIKLFEDFYLSLSLLTRGIPNTVIYDYGFDSTHGKPGGNSIIRTNILQKQCLEALQKEFPKYVKLVQRKAVSWSIGNPEFRWECIIQWKKALEEAVNK